MTDPALGRPPRLRGSSPAAVVCWAIACRASAAVLALEGHPDQATHLRHLATAAGPGVPDRGVPDMVELTA